jgi:branched-subunit amino acid ABC-type transport system permease component
MDAIVLQILNGLDKGGAYALIALGLTLIFGTLGVVNFAHGALFMLGAFCAVTISKLLTISKQVKDESITFFDAFKEQPYLEIWFGDLGTTIIQYAVPISILAAIPIMLLIGLVMERGLIRHFYKRPHAEQILVTFGLAIVLQEIVKHFFGANPIPTPAPPALAGSANVGAWLGLGSAVVYPWWRLVYLAFSLLVIGAVFAFLQFTTFGMVVRAGMQDPTSASAGPKTSSLGRTRPSGVRTRD